VVAAAEFVMGWWGVAGWEDSRCEHQHQHQR